MTQAALPDLRAQKSGHILQVSSIGGISAFPNVGLYHASKWGLEGFSQALAQEVASFGIKVTLIEPGGFDTDWGGSSSKHAKEIAAYDEIKKEFAEARKARIGKQGDPTKTAKAILAVVDSADPPLRLFLGNSRSASPRPTTRSGSRRGRNGRGRPRSPGRLTLASARIRFPTRAHIDIRCLRQLIPLPKAW